MTKDTSSGLKFYFEQLYKYAPFLPVFGGAPSTFL